MRAHVLRIVLPNTKCDKSTLIGSPVHRVFLNLHERYRNEIDELLSGNVYYLAINVTSSLIDNVKKAKNNCYIRFRFR